MAESTYHQMSVQHIKYLDKHRSPGLVPLVHQQQQQSHTPGAQHPWVDQFQQHQVGEQPISDHLR